MKIMKFKILFLYYVIIFLCIHVPANALHLNQNSVNNLTIAYGFVLGQEYSLLQISKKYLYLIPRVELARSYFSSTFQDIKTKLEKQLKDAMGETQFIEMANAM